MSNNEERWHKIIDTALDETVIASAVRTHGGTRHAAVIELWDGGECCARDRVYDTRRAAQSIATRDASRNANAFVVSHWIKDGDPQFAVTNGAYQYFAGTHVPAVTA